MAKELYTQIKHANLDDYKPALNGKLVQQLSDNELRKMAIHKYRGELSDASIYKIDKKKTGSKSISSRNTISSTKSNLKSKHWYEFREIQ